MTFPTPAAARISPRGGLHLATCPRCGHVANIVFNERLAHFDASFEAALFHSPTYTAYATSVVDRLVKRYDLVGKRVLEIASGSDVLIRHLTELGCDAKGVPGTTASGRYDLVLARFVLEHMANPLALLTALRKQATHLFIEVPDAGYDLTTAGWDCIHPHVGYFNSTSLTAVCARAGWSIVDTGTAFNDQYLWVEARAGEPTAPEPQTPPAFSLPFQEADAHWRATLAGKRTVVWGAGTRGTMFCNRIDPQATLIAGVVDRNPGKHGRYLPLAGHRVLAPAELPALQPHTVVLTNPAYRDEIAAELASFGLSPALLSA